MSKPIIYKDLKLDDKFNVAFPDHRIPNGVIDKTKTRLGITYSAFHARRDSLTVVSNVPIIDDAIANYPYLNLFPVYENVNVKDIETYLLSDCTYKRLVSTPESFGKIISAAENVGKLDWLYKDAFLYMDEFHCYATEAFRKDILKPFKWVDNFEQQAFGSATPFKSCNPKRMKMQHYKVTYDKKFGTISILNHPNPMAALHYLLTHKEIFKGNVHIFLNTVTGFGEAIILAGLTEDDANVYCRKDERNEINLGDAKVCFRERPIEGEYKKFNFYSCRYNEGWALKDDETAIIILVTDVHIPHSVVGIDFKGYQAMGRLNYTNIKRYHITNNYGKETMETFDTVQRNRIYSAEKYIPLYNQHIKDCEQDGMENDGRLKSVINDFASFNERGIADLNYEKLDQVIYARYYKEPYNNSSTIEQTWQSLNYETEFIAFDIAPIGRKRNSAKEINRQIVARYIDYKEHPERYMYEVATETIRKYRVEFDLLFQAIEILGLDEIDKLDYDNNAMKTALINRSNTIAEAKLRLILTDEFKINKRYTNKHIKNRLRELYEQFGIRKSDGTIKTAFADQLRDFGLFELKECKADDEHGRKKPGLEVIKLNFSLKIAA